MLSKMGIPLNFDVTYTALYKIITGGEFTMKENDFVERRQDLRMNMKCPVTVHAQDKERKETIRNLSTSGLKLETNDHLGVNDCYDFEFELPEGPLMKLEGKVCWRSHKGDAIYCGIRFHQLGIIPRIRLLYFLNRRIRQIKKKVMEEHNEVS
ncbi:MAG: hypothetical protein A2293_00575 [Elusimicrobia bacterium RIFOXYB2_FULL_49_7]|nr:MAG: hypothetical protein A2293_00575 [Elusimicrobia bacterium RIFOXYB2_FULL_49_7]